MERLLLIGVILTFISGFHCDRKITTNIKHGCYNNTNKCGSYGYIEAVGEKDTLHYLVSTLGLPTIFVAYTDKDVTAQVDLDSLLSPNITERQDTVTFTPSSGLKYSYAVAFTKLIDYNDTKDKADMTEYSPESTAYNVYDLGDFMWTNLSVTSTPEKNIIVLEALNSNKDDHELWLSNGTFSIQLSAFSESGREDQLPHLQYNENITQFDLNMDHLYTNLSKSRFAVEVAMIGSNAKEMHVDETRSIDDEYSPGVFTIYNWLSEKDDDKGFLQWKPVCYKSLTRSRAEAIAMKHYKMRLSTDIEPYINTLAYGYYGDKLMNTMINVGNFSFGISQDGGYNKTQVLTWSGSIGYGVPPADSISKLVIIIISAGLGLPVVLIIFGGIFVCIKKRNQPVEKPLRSIQGQGYQPLPNN